MNGLGNRITIQAPNMDEIDVLGFLLEKYVQGTSYNKETKLWSIPDKIYEQLKNK